MTDKKDFRMVESTDKEGNVVKVKIKNPTAQDYRDSQIVYNKAFRTALDSGALLRQKLSDYMEEQGIWDEAKQKKNDEFVEEINQMEEALKAGGIKLSDAKQLALDLRQKRLDFRVFLSEKNSQDANSVEGQADNARFAELARLCTLNPTNGVPYFASQEDYDAQADQPWVVEAAQELAEMLYGLDPDYDKGLEENKFLREFKFVNEDLRFTNKAGHLTDSDGRLVDDEGRFVAYRTPEAEAEQDVEQRYFVDRSGEEVVKVTNKDGEEEWIKLSLKERKPFLDDEGNPIISEAVPEKSEDIRAEKPKRTRAKKTEKDVEST